MQEISSKILPSRELKSKLFQLAMIQKHILIKHSSEIDSDKICYPPELETLYFYHHGRNYNKVIVLPDTIINLTLDTNNYSLRFIV